MDTDAVTLLLAMLAVAAQVAVVGAVVIAAAGPARARLVELLGPSALRLALLVAVVAMAGSLYLSEVAHFVPCRLCWYQRIAVYPLVPLLVVAVARRDDTSVVPFALALPLLGMPISAYHVLVERFPRLETSVCDPNNPCTVIQVERFGYLTIPTMALTAQALVLVLLLLARGAARRADGGG